MHIFHFVLIFNTFSRGVTVSKDILQVCSGDKRKSSIWSGRVCYTSIGHPSTGISRRSDKRDETFMSSMQRFNQGVSCSYFITEWREIFRAYLRFQRTRHSLVSGGGAPAATVPVLARGHMASHLASCSRPFPGSEFRGFALRLDCTILPTLQSSQRCSGASASLPTEFIILS